MHVTNGDIRLMTSVETVIKLNVSRTGSLIKKKSTYGIDVRGDDNLERQTYVNSRMERIYE